MVPATARHGTSRVRSIRSLRAEAWHRTPTETSAITPPVVDGNRSARSCYRAGLEPTRGTEATAAFAADDQTAGGLTRALHKPGRNMPGDVSTAGFDDITEGVYLHPPLMTAQQNSAVVGGYGVAPPLDRIEVRTGLGAERWNPFS
ncbi:substrate-binding domain-containing protein [Streptomyces sp. S1]|uniref:substrate-binding domain-containing protein n=1 Tax=Streptomyces sp. S1 TaxID=718288 RepID=UPI001F095F3C|nr:substrate-binding domain-containing protein [Streptomyces sp. S1]